MNNNQMLNIMNNFMNNNKNNNILIDPNNSNNIFNGKIFLDNNNNINNFMNNNNIISNNIREKMSYYKCPKCLRNIESKFKEDHLLCHQYEEADKRVLNNRNEINNNNMKINRQLRGRINNNQLNRIRRNNNRNRNDAIDFFDNFFDLVGFGLNAIFNEEEDQNFNRNNSYDIYQNANNNRNDNNRNNYNRNYNNRNNNNRNNFIRNNNWNNNNRHNNNRNYSYNRNNNNINNNNRNNNNRNNNNFFNVHQAPRHNNRNNFQRNNIISNFPQIKIEDLNKLEEGNRHCVICLDDFKIGEKVAALPCIHFFHNSCIQNWIKKQKNCPICKFELTQENLNNKMRENI